VLLFFQFSVLCVCFVCLWSVSSTRYGLLISPPLLSNGVRVVHFVLLCVFTFFVPCCNVRYHFRIKTMFGSRLLPVVCRRADVLFDICVCVCIMVSNRTCLYE